MYCDTFQVMSCVSWFVLNNEYSVSPLISNILPILIANNAQEKKKEKQRAQQQFLTSSTALFIFDEWICQQRRKALDTWIFKQGKLSDWVPADISIGTAKRGRAGSRQEVPESKREMEKKQSGHSAELNWSCVGTRDL